MVKEEVGKGAILTAGLGCVSAGIALIREGQLEYGIALLLVGFGLVVAYIYLLERQVVKKLGRVKVGGERGS